MNIGSLYLVKKWHWLLFASKEIASRSLRLAGDLGSATTSSNAAAKVAYWSKRYDCEVTYFSLDSIVVLLEEDGELKRVLTSDGKIGWIWVNENYNDSFEEVKTES